MTVPRTFERKVKQKKFTWTRAKTNQIATKFNKIKYMTKNGIEAREKRMVSVMKRDWPLTWLASLFWCLPEEDMTLEEKYLQKNIAYQLIQNENVMITLTIEHFLRWIHHTSFKNSTLVSFDTSNCNWKSNQYLDESCMQLG